jgi:ubiquinone biosynthesis protein
MAERGQPARGGQLIDDRGIDRAELSRALLRCMVYQITEGGVFHADPHPGNVLLFTDGRLALLDFGSVGVVSRTE